MRIVETADTQPPASDPAVQLPAATVSVMEYTRLDPRTIALWRLSGAIGFGITLVVLMPILAGVAGFALGQWLLAVGAWSASAALAVAWLIYYPPRRHAAWGYRLDRQVLETRRGVWFQTITLLPLSRLQHVDLQRGPLERTHGLASLVFHTAGTHESSIVLPGLDAAEATRLRDRLVAAGGDDGV